MKQTGEDKDDLRSEETWRPDLTGPEYQHEVFGYKPESGKFRSIVVLTTLF